MNRNSRLSWFISEARGSHYPNASSLADRFHVSLDTARRDIRHLRHELGAPLAHRGAQNGYFLADPHWQIPVQRERSDAAIAVASARQLLAGLSPELASDFERALSAHPRLHSALLLSPALMVTSSRAAGRRSPFLQRLLEACVEQRRLVISFESTWRDAPPSAREVSPWLLRLHDDHLYLHGLCHTAQDARCFPLAGVVDVADADGPHRREPRGFRKDLARGMGVGAGEPRRAEILLSGGWARFVSHEVWHPRQRDDWLDKGSGTPVLRRQFTYFLEQEVVRRLLPGGADVEVRTPLSLRLAVHAAFEAGARRNAPDGREVGATRHLRGGGAKRRT